MGQYGYYRVQYPLDDWRKFSTLLQSSPGDLSSSDRTSLINDGFALAKSGRISIDVALDLTQYLGEKERAVSPWEAAFLSLDSIAGVLYYTPVYAKLTNYISNLVAKPYNEVGWEANSTDTMEKLKLRTLVLSKMCEYGSIGSKKAGEMLLEWKRTGAKIQPDLRDIVYTYGMKEAGDGQVWQWMFNQYKNESSAQEKLKLLRGLTSVSEPWLLWQLLHLAKDENIIRSQDFFTVLNYMSGNRVGEPIVWDFVRNQWDYLVERFTLNNRLMGRMISYITENFATPLRLQEMKTFFEANPEAGAGASYRKIALETVENNILFVQKNLNVIDNWLE